MEPKRKELLFYFLMWRRKHLSVESVELYLGMKKSEIIKKKECDKKERMQNRRMKRRELERKCRGNERMRNDRICRTTGKRKTFILRDGD